MIFVESVYLQINGATLIRIFFADHYSTNIPDTLFNLWEDILFKIRWQMSFGVMVAKMCAIKNMIMALLDVHLFLKQNHSNEWVSNHKNHYHA